MEMFHDYEINFDKDEEVEEPDYSIDDFHPSEINEVFPPEDELEDEEENMTEEIEWIEEFEAKKFDDIFEYLDAKRKILNGDITEIYIEANSYNPDYYDFRWR